MELANKNLSKLKIGLLIFGAYSFFLVVKIIPVYLSALENPDADKSLSRNIWLLVSYYFVSALITPLILWAGSLMPFGKGKSKRNLILHLIIALTLGIVQFYVYAALITVLGYMTIEEFKAFFNLAKLSNNGLTAIIFYAVIVAVQQAYIYFRESQERALQLQRAELDMLKLQLQPHFLFNALNAIAALVYKYPHEADRTLTQLSDLLRASLKNGKTQEVTLKEEMEFLQAYLEIHQTLMKQRLVVDYKIQPETLDAMIPNMMLQPIVENSIKHGLAPLEKGGRIEISAHRRNDTLNLLMADNGKGLGRNKSASGIGLTNTRARLKNLYGAAHKIDVNAPSDGGFAVEIEIPFREQKGED